MSDFDKRRTVGARRPNGPLDSIDLTDTSALHEPPIASAWGEPDTTQTVADEPADDTCPWNVGPYDWEGEVLRIVDWQEVERGLKSKTASTGYMESKRLTALQATFRDRGDYRKLTSVPDDWRARLNAMQVKFPNFAAVIAYLRGACAVASCGGGVPQLSPLLLNGSPGVGKTLFASSLSDFFGSRMVALRMETSETASALTGSDEHWANSRPGHLFDALVEGDFANPLFFLDEIDKAGGGPARDPLASLYSLLEPTTAKAFKDLSYPWITLNASHVMWVCTSNDAAVLPAPILDRLRRFDIEKPTAEQAVGIVETIFDEVTAELRGTGALITLSEAAKTYLAATTPRQVKKLIREALGRMLYEGRRIVTVADVKLDNPNPASAVQRMGFLS